MGPVILDASAVLAVLKGEPGAEAAREHVPDAVISAVNLAEVASKLSDWGLPDDEFQSAIGTLALGVEPFDAKAAMTAARLRRDTRALGLSLGDRACLALAVQRGLPVLTTDRSWAGLDIGVEVGLVRLRAR